MGKKVLAFDFGGSSCRALIGKIVDEKLVFSEINRYDNGCIEIDGCLHWDFEYLWKNMLESIKIASQIGFDSIGIDTWGVDYGLISTSGQLIGNPFHYRDKRTVAAYDQLHKIIPASALYKRTGIQPLRINTIYQLYEQFVMNTPPKNVDKFLFMPDLFAYMLTGQIKCERTIASTSGLFCHTNNDWDYQLIEQLHLPKDIFPTIINSGQSYGMLSDSLCTTLNISPVPVVAICSHDTASAIMAVPSLADTVYISCGTWSLMGTMSQHVNTADTGFTNEYGYDYITYLTNIMGLWLLQETRRNLKQQSFDTSYDNLNKLAALAPTCQQIINPNSPDFELPCDMPKAIADYCQKTNQPKPTDVGQLIKCIYSSLAMCYKFNYDKFNTLNNKTYDALHIFGGGANIESLCQMTADAVGVKVVAGPVEATAIGNILAQLLYLEEIAGIEQATKLVIDSCDIRTYLPNPSVDYSVLYNKFLELVK